MCIHRLTGKEKRIGGFDLIWDDGPVLADDSNMECSVNGNVTTTNSFLGNVVKAQIVYPFSK